MGLTRAIDLYDPYRGFAFSTYATPWIRQAVSRFIANLDRTIRIPVHVIDDLRRFQRQLAGTQAEVRPQEAPAPAPSLAAQAADSTPLSWERLRERECRDGHIPSALVVDEGWREDADATQLATALRRLLGRLPPRTRDVVELRHGLRDGRTRTLEEVGRGMNLTRERVRQIEVRAFKSLRLDWYLLGRSEPPPEEGENDGKEREPT
jgi:RNA polymerase sigma factor (sigma-70 family)